VTVLLAFLSRRGLPGSGHIYLGWLAHKGVIPR
jgi:hypothetical protein